VPAALAARARSARRRLQLERDLRDFRSRYGSVLAPVPRTGAGTALLASLSYSPFQLKLEGMLAKGLQLAGLDVVAAVPPKGDLPRRYLETFGIRRFVTLEDHMGAGTEAEAEREADRILAGASTIEELKTATFRGAGVGRQALSTESRHVHEGTVDLRNGEVRADVRRFLALAVRTTSAADRLLDSLAPDLVLFNERNYAAEGPLSDLALARGLNVIQFVAGFADDALVFKRYTHETRRLHPRSLSDASWERVRALEWTPERDRELEDDFRRRYAGETYVARLHPAWTREQSREDVAARLGVDPARKTAVIFSHVLWDANMFYGRDLFADQEEWFVETVRTACANDRVNWVVKLHPANAWKLKRDGYAGELAEHRAIREKVGTLPSHVRLLEPDTDISPRSLFALTDYGLTIRGSIGFELPCFGVPVLTAGTGFYSGRGFTVDSETPAEYIARISSIEQIPPLDEEARTLARKHAYALFRLRQTRFTSFRQVYSLDRPQPAEATIEVSMGSLEEADDLRRFGNWAGHSRALDYLEEPR
jgi:hypothetical protein